MCALHFCRLIDLRFTCGQIMADFVLDYLRRIQRGNSLPYNFMVVLVVDSLGGFAY